MSVFHTYAKGMFDHFVQNAFSNKHLNLSLTQQCHLAMYITHRNVICQKSFALKAWLNAVAGHT